MDGTESEGDGSKKKEKRCEETTKGERRRNRVEKHSRNSS